MFEEVYICDGGFRMGSLRCLDGEGCVLPITNQTFLLGYITDCVGILVHLLALVNIYGCKRSS